MSDMTPQAVRLSDSVDGMRQRAMIVGAVGIAAAIAGAVLNPAQFFQSYLVAFVFWTSVALGCLGLLMLQHLSGGQWGLVTRRVFEAGARNLPMMGVLFLVIVPGLPYVYEWARPEDVARDAILKHKAPYLTPWFFIARTVGYFVIWSTMAFLLSKWSRQQDESKSDVLDKRFGRLSGPGLVVFALTVSLASVDWLMSVDPHWYSTIYGFVMMGGSGLAALGFTVLVLNKLFDRGSLHGIVRAHHYHDLGKLIFAFVLLYAYFTFSQFLITWSANLPEEIPWFIKRLNGGWQFMFLLLVLGHFVVPFSILLSSEVKRSATRLSVVAIMLFVMRYLDTLFQVAPQFHKGVYISWIDLAVVVGMGGLWVAMFLGNLRGRPALPVNDPYFHEVLATGHGAH